MLYHSNFQEEENKLINHYTRCTDKFRVNDYSVELYKYFIIKEKHFSYNSCLNV